MNYHLHENGWTVILDEFNLSECTQEDIQLIGDLVNTHTLVVARKQFITIEQELDFIRKFRNPIPVMSPSAPGFSQIAADPEGLILRVSGIKDKDGDPIGMAGHESEMAWHSNPPEDPARNSIVYLRGVEGTVGSQTEWNNTILVWRDLPQAHKDQLLPLKIVPKVGYTLEGYVEGENGKELVDQPRFDLVHTNIAGEVGLNFPFIQISRFDSMTVEESKQIIDTLAEIVIRPEYCYKHDWQDGDVVLAEQWLGIHRRLPFKAIGTRLLHRAGFDAPIKDTR